MKMKQKQTSVYRVDLTRIDGSGDFQCPRCGATLSPDDTTEETYAILETKVNSNGLDEIVVQCKTCASQIHLTGFLLLQNLP